MKKLLALSFLAFTLFSCTKEEETNNEEKKYNVAFSVTDFSQTVGTLSATKSVGGSNISAVGDTLANWADHLNYKIYNSNGVLVNSKSQNKTDNDFGKITDQLPIGSYKVFFVANKGGNAIFSPSSYDLSIAQFSPANVGQWDDTFTQTLDLTVTGASTQTIRLDRVVGGLEVILEDAIRAQTSKISIVYKTESFMLHQKDNSSVYVMAGGRDFTITSADINQVNRKFLSFIANTFNTSDVTIKAMDSNDRLLAEKTITGVRVYRNKKTTLSGKLFPEDGGSLGSARGFNIVVNPLWDTTNTTTIRF